MFVSLMAGKAEVTYDPDRIGAAGVASLIEDLGFGATLVEAGPASPGRLDLRVTGMSCSSCVHKIQSKLGSTRGVVSASVSLATSSAQVHYHPEAVGARDLLAIIQVLTTSGSVLVSSAWNISVLSSSRTWDSRLSWRRRA